MPIKKIQLDNLHPANPLNDIVVGVNDNFYAILDAIKNINNNVPVVGETGSKGDPGPQGPAGIQGPQGLTGPAGVDGTDGENGKDGVAGRDGIDGRDGSPGVPGPQGPKGDTGAQGIQGLPGKDGKDGLAGLQGPKGDTGSQGPAGKDGTNSGSGLSIANTAGTASWINLGTWTTVNQGTTLYLRIISHAGFNADPNQNQVTEVYFKTSNANSNIGGFYGDGTASRNTALGPCNVAPSVIRVVQNSQTSYTFYGYFTTWSAGSHYTFSTDGASNWTHNGALATQPAGTYIDISPMPTGIKTVSGYVDAGIFVTLDNIKASVTTSGSRGLSVATVAGTFQAMISGTFGYITGVGGSATAGNNIPTYTTTPSGSWFGWNFPNAGDGSTYLVNDITNQRFYRINLMIGPGYTKNFISIERLSDGIPPAPPPVAPRVVGVASPTV